MCVCVLLSSGLSLTQCGRLGHLFISESESFVVIEQCTMKFLAASEWSHDINIVKSTSKDYSVFVYNTMQ